jgi:hypothetical protein
MDGPELQEPTEAEVESEIQQLLNNTDDRDPSQELTLVGVFGLDFWLGEAGKV